MHFGQFELRKDEDTDRLYWWGAEDGWKDPDEVGTDGVLEVDAKHFQVGTVLHFREPDEGDLPDDPRESAEREAARYLIEKLKIRVARD